MAFHIRNPETDRLARRVAALKKIGLTEAVHTALQHELEREETKPSAVDIALEFVRELRKRSNPEKALPVDKAFYDALSGQE